MNLKPFREATAIYVDSLRDCIEESLEKHVLSIFGLQVDLSKIFKRILAYLD